jgi:hypothetical protein
MGNDSAQYEKWNIKATNARKETKAKIKEWQHKRY